MDNEFQEDIVHSVHVPPDFIMNISIKFVFTWYSKDNNKKKSVYSVHVIQGFIMNISIQFVFTWHSKENNKKKTRKLILIKIYFYFSNYHNEQQLR